MEKSFYLTLVSQNKIGEIEKIKKCNESIGKYGLVLSEKDINSIVEKRIESLVETQRIEVGDWIIDKFIMEFCDSPYVKNESYSETINELIEMFYYYKNETKDLVSDDDLIKFMKKNFDGICNGSLEYLKGTVLAKMTDNVLNGKSLEYSVEDEEKYE